MNSISSKEGSKLYKEQISFTLIILFITLLISLIESIFILLQLTYKGIFKKEVLSSRSPLGFDLEIRMK